MLCSPDFSTGPFLLIVHVRKRGALVGAREASRMSDTSDSTEQGGRESFLEKGRAALSELEKGSFLGVIVLDVDRFTAIEAGVGAVAADLLLENLRERFLELVRKPDLVVHLGRDEFGILAADLPSDVAALQFTERITDAFSRPFPIPPNEMFVTGSFGISLAVSPDDDISDLLSEAYEAVEVAKRMGSGCVEMAVRNRRALVRKSLHDKKDLGRAIEADELRLYYQPIIDISTYKISGLEAFVRWVHPDLGVIDAREFIELAEETGLIIPIGNWGIRATAQLAATWRREHPETASLTYHMNLSERQLRQDDLSRVLLETLEDTGVPADALCIEVGDALLALHADIRAQTRVCKDLGFQVAIDKFGSSVGSLHLMKKEPVDYVKLSRRMFAQLKTEDEGVDAAMVEAVVTVAKQVGLRVVATGVETAAQAVRLRARGVALAQGFHFMPPMPSESIERLLGAPLPHRDASVATN